MDQLLLTLADKGIVSVIAGFVLLRLDTRMQQLAEQIALLVAELRTSK